MPFFPNATGIGASIPNAFSFNNAFHSVLAPKIGQRN